ncbi:MAG: hypothetical protein IPH12_19290 [Saprospirales bacterium]|nr:hypothetical protein [Saprospirales bacterium]
MKKSLSKTRRKWLDASSWALLIESYGSSELSVKDFCASQGVSVASYYRWQNRLKEDKHADSTLFSPIEIQSKGKGGIVVELPGGVVLRFEALPPVEYVRSLSLTFSGAEI